MFSNHQVKVLGAVAVALAAAALSGPAMAQNLEATTTGDIFLNVVNTSSDSSYLYNTGLSQAAFSSTSNYQYILTGDSNFTGFLAGCGVGDVNCNFSVIDATKTGSASTVFFTGNASSTAAVSAFKLNQTQSPISSFLIAAALSSTAGSSEVITTADYWGAAGIEGVLSKQLFGNSLTPYSDNGAINSSLQFYGGAGSTLSTFAGQWTLSTTGTGNLIDTLTYNGVGTQPVPLPTPVLLLVSGLGLMGVVSRRRKIAA
ncbi:MAG: hypothetical protein ACLPV8_27585 [Steroidobacteraceae bacterium]